MLELTVYEDIPHLLVPVVTDPKKAAAALFWAMDEMDRRYRLMRDKGARNIDNYNRTIEKEAAKKPVVELERSRTRRGRREIGGAASLKKRRWCTSVCRGSSLSSTNWPT